MTLSISSIISTDPSQFIESQKMYIKDFPNELLLHIFEYLSFEDLSLVSCVCKKWNQLTSDSFLWESVERFFPQHHLHIFDEKSWRACDSLSQLRVDPTMQSNNRAIVRSLKKLFTSIEIDNKKGVTLLTMPKGLSIRMLTEKYPYMFRVDPDLNFIKKTLWDTPISTTYRIAIINKLFQESRGLSYKEQDKFVRKIGCEIPQLLEIMTWTVINYINGTHFFEPIIEKSSGEIISEQDYEIAFNKLKSFTFFLFENFDENELLQLRNHGVNLVVPEAPGVYKVISPLPYSKVIDTYTYCLGQNDSSLSIIAGKSITHRSEHINISTCPDSIPSNPSLGIMAVYRLS